MFAACGKGFNGRIYMIGGINPDDQKWTCNATYIQNIAVEMQNKND